MVTLAEAAQAAADREGLGYRVHLAGCGSAFSVPVDQCACGGRFFLTDHQRDLYVRAFRQGAHWQIDQVKQIHEEMTRVATLKTSPSPTAGSTAATDQG